MFNAVWCWMDVPHAVSCIIALDGCPRLSWNSSARYPFKFGCQAESTVCLRYILTKALENWVGQRKVCDI